MQTSDAIENRAGCTCRLDPVQPRGWIRIGEPCPFCRAWHLSIVSRSMEPLKEFGYGLERTDGETETDG
jgi:hypothetical protein